jgi:amidase
MNTPLSPFSTARDLAKRIRYKEISATEVMQAHLAQIEKMNPKVNAIVTLTADQALAQAKRADEAQAHGDALGILHGLPVAHKDLVETKGIRTTYGSPIYKHYIPTYDALHVERLKQAGAITIGKTNTPEFGAGSQTFNTVFGATLNPYDTTKTCGGSSGGAAVALACGMIPIADGSDMGGSLRNPAAFCNVVGLRPTPGRVPIWPSGQMWGTLSVDGPMARTVGDVALMLAAMSGPDPRVALALTDPPEKFLQPLDRDLRGVRVAWLNNLPGVKFDKRVTEVVNSQRKVFESLGCVVEDAMPDFSDADTIFQALRAYSFVLGRQNEYKNYKHLLKDTILWNYEEGLKLSAQDVAVAELKRQALWQRVREFMQTYEFMILPVTQVPPFDVTQPYVTEIDGEAMPNYIAWMKSCYYISILSNPAISVPAGFTSEGLPIGLQIVGRIRDDFGVLQIAHAYESATEYWKVCPI